MKDEDPIIDVWEFEPGPVHDTHVLKIEGDEDAEEAIEMLMDELQNKINQCTLDEIRDGIEFTVKLRARQMRESEYEDCCENT